MVNVQLFSLKLGQSRRPNSENTSEDYCFGLNDNFENQILNGF